MTAQAPPTPRSSPRKAALASTVGTTIEWYDYFIFGTAAALVFNKIFFPELSSVAGTLASFSTFAVGFVARPLGAVLFGHFGDRLGRKPMMVLTLMIMGASTVLMGLLPTYEMVGVWAPILLVSLRVLQGLSVGGEWGAAALMTVENSPEGKRGFYGSLPGIGSPLGILLSSGIFGAVTLLASDDQFLSWGWRIPFLLSSILIVIGLLIRLSLEESPVFVQAVKKEQAAATVPLVTLFKKHALLVFAAAGTYAAGVATFYLVTTWLINYSTTELSYNRTSVLLAGAAGSIVSIVAILNAGRISDRFGRRRICALGAGAVAIYIFPFFWLVNSGNIWLLLLAISLAMVVTSLISGPVAALFSELFDTDVRYSGASISFQIAAVVGGGFMPIICTSLFNWADSTWPIAVYIIALEVVALICVALIPDTTRKNLVENTEQTSAVETVDSLRPPSDPLQHK